MSRDILYDQLHQICEEVEREWNAGGLSDGMYGDFAKEVARRALLNSPLIGLIRRARKEGWYESYSGWEEVDAILAKEEKSCG